MVSPSARARPLARNGNGARLVLHAVGFELLLGAADPGDLGAGVDDPGNGVEVDMPVLAGHALGHRNALFLGLVRQHGAAHHIAHRPDARQVGLAIGIDDDGAALVELQAHGLGIQARWCWARGRSRR